MLKIPKNSDSGFLYSQQIKYILTELIIKLANIGYKNKHIKDKSNNSFIYLCLQKACKYTCYNLKVQKLTFCYRDFIRSSIFFLNKFCNIYTVISQILALYRKLTIIKKRITSKQEQMNTQKHLWKQVISLSSSSHKPSPRWGHSCCVVQDDIVFFGGYADSNYMNDLWAFNSKTMKWRQIETTGDIPCHRSNCSMNYDKENKQIIIFGGGGSNKQRFNSISILDWKSKEWIEINPKQNEVAPWQRTYHVAEFLNPYLVVFGGQGVSDLQDLWIFSFETLSWTEVKIPADKIKPCARRFHSSAMIGNEFFVLAGCHGKYRCLSDVYSLDLSSLLETGKVDGLEWKQKKLKNTAFLTRWGHSSSVYNNKIYIFGGRFSNDLNDLLVADLENNTIKQIKTNPEAPPARRRHCAGFLGSSLIVFGGFNGQYFQDMHYIDMFEAKPRNEIHLNENIQIVSRFLNNQRNCDYELKTKNGEEFYLNVGMIYQYFRDETDFKDFFDKINYSYSTQELNKIFIALYQGYGNLEQILETEQVAMLEKNNRFPESWNEKINLQREKIDKKFSQQSQSKPFKKISQNAIPLAKLNQEAFTDYFLENKQKAFCDIEIVFGQTSFYTNKIKLINKSAFFKNMFTQKTKAESFTLRDILHENETESKIVYDIFINYLENGWLVLTDNVSEQTLTSLIVLGDYFCVSEIVKLCVNELLTLITPENVQMVLQFAIKMKLNTLTTVCCDFWVKKIAQNLKIEEVQELIEDKFKSNLKQKDEVKSMFQNSRFNLCQSLIQNEKKLPTLTKKGVSNSSIEKENFETNIFHM